MCDPCLSALEVVSTMRYTNRRLLYYFTLLYYPSDGILYPSQFANFKKQWPLCASCAINKLLSHDYEYILLTYCITKLTGRIQHC